MTHRQYETVVLKAGSGLFDLNLRGVWRHRELLLFLVWRDLKVRYAQTWLGVAWAVVQPVLALLVFTAVFGIFAGFPSDGFPYPVVTLAALLPWTLFADAARRGALGLFGDAELIRKIYFPRLVIPIANVLAPLVDFAIGLVLLLVLMAWYGIWPGRNLLLLPGLILIILGMALAFALWLGPLHVRFHDISHTLPLFFQVWMYATPIVYPLSMVPEQWRLLYSLNPFVGIVEGFRWSLLGVGSFDTLALGISCAFTALFLIGGMIKFRKAERSFADYI